MKLASECFFFSLMDSLLQILVLDFVLQNHPYSHLLYFFIRAPMYSDMHICENGDVKCCTCVLNQATYQKTKGTYIIDLPSSHSGYPFCPAQASLFSPGTHMVVSLCFSNDVFQKTNHFPKIIFYKIILFSYVQQQP